MDQNEHIIVTYNKIFHCFGFLIPFSTLLALNNNITFEKGWQHLYFYNLVKKSFLKVIALSEERDLISEAINPNCQQRKTKGNKVLGSIYKKPLLIKKRRENIQISCLPIAYGFGNHN